MGVFDKIKMIISDKIEEKKEEIADEKELKKEAKVEARDELKRVYKDSIIDKEKKKIAKGSVLDRIGKEFQSESGMFGQSKIDRMLGKESSSTEKKTKKKETKEDKMFDQDRITKMFK